MSVQQLITENLDIWTAAHKTRSSAGRGSSNKLDLVGIKKLRELILELAVRGNLVPQDPNDEPACELLDRIARDIAESAKTGKIKKITQVYPDSEDEEFELPTGWELVKFGSICTIERGGSPRPIQDFLTNDQNGINWIKIGDSDIGGKYITATSEKIRKEGLKKTRMVYPGDFLLTNSMSFGRPYITQIEGCIHDGWLRISPPKELDKDFLYSLLSSPFIFRSFKKAAAGAVVLNLNADKVRLVGIPLPPLAEQHRIVAKVDELMAFCDQLEQTQSDNIAAHAQLVEALLATLVASTDHQDLQNNWQRIAAHFDTLFTTEHSIDQLKQTILQLAVMGKLVPQNPNDEPASELLKKIDKEKGKLIKEGKIKKQKPLPEIKDEEKPFELPSGWIFCRLDDICTGITSGSTPSQNEFLDLPGVPYLKVYNIKEQKIDFNYKPQYVSEECSSQKLKRSILYPGDVLMNIVGPPLGKVAIVPQTFPEWNCNQAITFFRPILRQMPPLAEQNRIVTKVNELMTLCDSLKTNLQNAQATRLALAESLVEQAVN